MRMRRLLTRLLRDERGTALVYVTALLTVLGGVGVLARDLRLHPRDQAASRAGDRLGSGETREGKTTLG